MMRIGMSTFTAMFAVTLACIGCTGEAGEVGTGGDLETGSGAGGSGSHAGDSGGAGGSSSTAGSEASGGAAPGSGGSAPGGSNASGGAAPGSGGSAPGGSNASGGASPGGSAGSGGSAPGGSDRPDGSGAGGTTGSPPAPTATTPVPLPPGDLPAAGNPDGHCAIPAEAQQEDVSKPTTVVGSGTKASCTGDAFVAAVAKGGVITFSCGPDPVTITLSRTAKVFNDKGPNIVIDGGGKVTLSGGNKVRILYQNTCDENQTYTTSHCQNQDHPRLTVQNLTFANGNAKGEDTEGGGGGAIFVRGGRLKVNRVRFFNNVCDDVGPDVGGAAIRTLSQYNDLPVYVVDSTFGGRDDLGNTCSNGGGLSSIGVSHTVINSLYSYNNAIGHGANPAEAGTPGGGSGGAIYNDGNTFTLSLCGTKINDNVANEGGGAIFFVSNDQSGHLIIKDSTLSHNPSKKFETQGFPGIFAIASGLPQVSGSTLQK